MSMLRQHTAHADRPPVTTVPFHVEDLSSWELPPVRLLGLHAAAVAGLVRDLGETPSRLVELPGTSSVAAFRRTLPRRFAVQPESETAWARIVLVYRFGVAPTGQAEGRLGYLLVDLLAFAQSDRTLDVDLYRKLEQLLPGLAMVPSSMREHVLARARWCRTAAVHEDEIDLSEATGGQCLELGEFVAAVAGTRADLHDGVKRVRSLLCIPVPRSESPTLTMVASVPTAQADEGFDAAAIQARRAETERVLKALTGLDETGGAAVITVEQAPATSPGELSAPVRELALRLAERPEHDLGQVRLLAHALGLPVALDALRLINEWAEYRSAALGRNLDVAVVEVDQAEHAVWVDHILEDLLA
jgi:hypothetical protein